jgi:hypothetical protein
MATKETILQKLLDDLSNVSTTPTGDTAEEVALYLKAYRDLGASLPIGCKIFSGSDSGSTDAYAITISGYTSYANLDTFVFRANTVNTGTASFNVSPAGAKTIYKSYNTELSDGDIKAGQIVILTYDSVTDSFQMLGSPSAATSSSSGSPSTYISNAVFDSAF